MKSVLISIQPKWCELIASGKKTVEVRKTKPKLETPFKVYIYCTKAKEYFSLGGGLYACSDELYRLPTGEIKFGDSFELAGDWLGQYNEDIFYNGKVIGEFVCDEIYTVNKDSCGWFYENANEVMGIMYAEEVGELYHCIPDDELKHYLGHKVGYGWHISNLVIYDKPRGLGEFKKIHRECWYADLGLAKRDCPECKNADCFMQRPPQSWGYVESEVEDNA